MKLGWKIAAGLVAVGALSALCLWRSADGPQRAFAETRRTLREQGVKTDNLGGAVQRFYRVRLVP